MVYKITNYSYKKAEENDLNIIPSTKKYKKIDVYKNGVCANDYTLSSNITSDIRSVTAITSQSEAMAELT